MKRAALVLLASLAIVSIASAAPEKWFEAYKRGVSAVNAKSYRAAVDALQKSIAEMPNEGMSVRAGKEIIIYVPHFWLGIAKFNVGDVDGALREWRTSEEQGVITRTEYYARMKDWVSRAQTEKQRNAQSEASGPKKEADAAISKALAMQVDALSAGGDRSDSYRAAQRKLQEALTQFHQAGTDVGAYQTTEQTAQQATALFVAAAEEGKKQRAARQTVPAGQKAQPQPVKQQPKPVLITNVPATSTQPPPKVEPASPPPPVQSEAQVGASVAVQQYRRNVSRAPKEIARVEVREADRLRGELKAAKSDAEFVRIGRETRERDAAMAKSIEAAALAQTKPVPTPEAPVAGLKPDLSGAFRLYAAGDLAEAEDRLTQIIQTRSMPEAFLLRGCVRYTRALLARAPETMLAAAAADFKTALQTDRALRLDRRAFSPKLVAFFERVREKR